MSTNPQSDPATRPSTVDRRWVLIAAVVALTLVVVVLGAYAFLPKSSPAQTASPGDQSAYAQLFAQIGPNGEVTKEMALEAFSLAIAPLPGVTVPSGPPPQDYERMDGTFAIDWIRPYLDQLTPDQQAAVKAALTLGPDTVPIPLAPPQSRTRIELASYSAADLTSIVATDIPIIESKLGRTLSYDSLIPRWYISINSSETKVLGQNALAYTCDVQTTCPVPGGNLPVASGYCAIVVNPSLINSGKNDLIRASMAHELFHCFQDDWFAQNGGDKNLPGWIIEGQAAWVGETVGGLSDAGAALWRGYLASRPFPLWSRNYTAIGFYQQLQDEGINPWTHFDAMLATDTNEDAFKAAGATDETFLNAWASGEFKNASLGQEWNAYGPWLNVGAPPPDKIGLANGDTDEFDTPAVTVKDLEIDSSAEVVVAELLDGNARIHTDPPGNEVLTADPRFLCTMIGGCECPSGQHYEGPPLEEVGPTIDIGETGGLDGAAVEVDGHKLADFCKPGQPTPRPSCQSNCGNSNGDPHLRTINRYKYDFQGAGEFVLLRNADDSVEVQARQEPYPSNYFHGVATNTAVALKDNGHKVSVYGASSGFVLHVDGQRVDSSSAPDLGPGAYVKPISNGLEIGFPDGTIVSTLSLGQWGINVVVQASPKLLRSGVGLLGPITPGGMGVPALPDGTQLPAAPDTATRDQILYGQFADAWRVTDATSLFDYDPGKSTATYTDKSFPSDSDRQALETALASPDPSQQAAAQSACAAITDPDLLDECTFDVYATGDAGFAQQYSVTQDLYDSGIAPPTAPPSEPPASPGGVVGAVKITDIQDLDGSAIGPDNTLYVSVTDSSGAPQLLAVDPTTSAVKTQAALRVAKDIHFAAGSVWVSGEATDSGGGYCTVTRYDPGTLAKQGDYPIPCTNGAPPTLTSMGDSVWFIDTTKTDPNTGAGTALTQIDPTSNAPGKSVPLGYAGGCCQGSQGAVFCSCGQSDTWRLTSSDSAFVDLGNYTTIYPAGTGFWTEQGQSALLVSGPSSTTTALPLPVGGNLVGGDPAGIYVQGEQTGQKANFPLLHQPVDGSPPAQTAIAPTYGADITLTQLDYGKAFPSFSLPDGYLHLWVFKETPDSPLALWEQWAPLP